MKVAHQTLQSNIARAAELNYPPIDVSLYVGPKEAEIAQRTPETVRTRNQVQDLKKQLTDALKKLADLEDIRSSIFGLQPDRLQIPNWQTALQKGKSRPEIATLFTSDFQCGEVIREEELEYPNNYDPAIFAERYRRLITTTIKLLQREDPGMTYPGFIYLRGGDAIRPPNDSRTGSMMGTNFLSASNGAVSRIVMSSNCFPRK